MTKVDDLLAKTSRTFAVTIPMLPAPTRHEVGIAYLLFRVIDTFEDSTLWTVDRRIEMLGEFGALLDGATHAQAVRFADRCLAEPPLEHEGYLELLREIPFVLGELSQLRAASRACLEAHVRRSAEGMALVVSRADAAGCVKLNDIEELRGYCYLVAGIVGEMLTELFLLDREELHGIGNYLRERSRMFGEGLQLVNILKDWRQDQQEGRIYLPATVDRTEVFALARADLRGASEYTLALQSMGADRGLVIFNALLVRLANDTLKALREERPSGKLSRAEVFAIVTAVLRDVEDGRPVFPLTGSDTSTSVAV